MLDVATQIKDGKLVCPLTHQRLSVDTQAGSLVTRDGKIRYGYLDGKVPILLPDPGWAAQYASASQRMAEEYAPSKVARRRSYWHWLKTNDYRTRASNAAFDGLFDGLMQDALCLSIGGGPFRRDPRLVNVNIWPFPNVDVVGDAHKLPYAEGCVDAIFCEAVLEHLGEPAGSVREMCRVLRPGGRVYAVTPFIAPYHGYPDHYQSYTLTGHTRLFSSRGFNILESGVCVGPVYTLFNLIYVFLAEFVPKPLNVVARKAWGVLGLGIRPLDRLVQDAGNAHVLASSTFILAHKG